MNTRMNSYFTICHVCNGSGEGRCTQVCLNCGGQGEIEVDLEGNRIEPDPDDFNEPDPEEVNDFFDESDRR